MRELLDTPDSEWRAERAKVESQGWGARLLSYEDEDGSGRAVPLSLVISTPASGGRSDSLGPPRPFR